MTKRQVRQGLLSYRDADGVWRHALQGTEVDVHRDYLGDFDKLNGTEDEPKKAAPAKKAATKRK